MLEFRLENDPALVDGILTLLLLLQDAKLIDAAVTEVAIKKAENIVIFKVFLFLIGFTYFLLKVGDFWL